MRTILQEQSTPPLEAANRRERSGNQVAPDMRSRRRTRQALSSDTAGKRGSPSSASRSRQRGSPPPRKSAKWVGGSSLIETSSMPPERRSPQHRTNRGRVQQPTPKRPDRRCRNRSPVRTRPMLPTASQMPAVQVRLSVIDFMSTTQSLRHHIHYDKQAANGAILTRKIRP